MCMCLVNFFPYRNLSGGEVVYVVIKQTAVLQIKTICLAMYKGYTLFHIHTRPRVIFVFYLIIFWCLLKDKKEV